MKLSREKLRQLIKEELKRLSYASKEQGHTYGIEHLPDQYDQKKADDIIGHTWLTHVRKKGSSLNEVGYVLWHSLNESGHVAVYDVEWPNGTIERNIFLYLINGHCYILEIIGEYLIHFAYIGDSTETNDLNCDWNQEKNN